MIRGLAMLGPVFDCSAMPPHAQTTADEKATGDQSVFASHDISMWIGEQEHVDYDRRVPVPPVYLSTSVHVFVNEGKPAGRVDGLEVWIDGERVRETSSAVAPPSYSFQHYRRAPERGHAYRIELRYLGATFVTTIQPRTLAIATPAPDTAVSSADLLTVRWSSEGAGEVNSHVEAKFYGDSAHGSCAVQFEFVRRSDSDAIFRPSTRDSGQPPPCTGEATVVWHASDVVAGPFRNLVVSHDTSRLRRFDIR